MERLDEENAARTRLTLELHQARGERQLRGEGLQGRAGQRHVGRGSINGSVQSKT